MKYTYESIVAKAKALEKKSAKKIDEHIAIQVNVEGEGEGIFYIEIADHKVSVEPYDYYDNDAVLVGDAENVINFLKNKTGEVAVYGNQDKVELLKSVIPNKRVTKTAAEKKTAEKKPAEKKTAPKKTAAKKAAPAKKATAAKKPATKAASKEATVKTEAKAETKTTAKKTTAKKATAKKASSK